LEEQWRDLAGMECRRRKVCASERVADILLSGADGSLSVLAEEVKMASSVWLLSILFSTSMRALTASSLSLPTKKCLPQPRISSVFSSSSYHPHFRHQPASLSVSLLFFTPYQP